MELHPEALLRSYHVRTARHSDLSALPEVEHAAAQLFASTPHAQIAGEPISPVEEFAIWLERGALFVAVDERDAPVGFAIAYELDGATYLHEIDVHPDHGRRGVGRLLIEFVGDRSIARGLRRLTLSTFRDVPWNAPYYRRLGFRELIREHAGPGLRMMREGERRQGLQVERRLFMALDLPAPGTDGVPG